jgi:hypothetical protein
LLLNRETIFLPSQNKKAPHPVKDYGGEPRGANKKPVRGYQTGDDLKFITGFRLAIDFIKNIMYHS